MKITDVIIHQLRADIEKPFASSRGWWYKTKNALLVEVETDEGIVGWGDRDYSRRTRTGDRDRP